MTNAKFDGTDGAPPVPIILRPLGHLPPHEALAPHHRPHHPVRHLLHSQRGGVLLLALLTFHATVRPSFRLSSLPRLLSIVCCPCLLLSGLHQATVPHPRQREGGAEGDGAFAHSMLNLAKLAAKIVARRAAPHSALRHSSMGGLNGVEAPKPDTHQLGIRLELPWSFQPFELLVTPTLLHPSTVPAASKLLPVRAATELIRDSVQIHMHRATTTRQLARVARSNAHQPPIRLTMSSATELELAPFPGDVNRQLTL
mmetsp:Transcript_60804/g.125264  ORF Transcript_60804/g.125264 Transcript_60804/m.125264 type:complete len:256 (-) Transcript_60804:444-1211(-)